MIIIPDTGHDCTWPVLVKPFLRFLFRSKMEEESREDWRVKLNKFLHEKNIFTDLLAQVEEKTGISRLYLVLAGGVLLAGYLIIGYGSTLICNCIGFVFPAYSSIKAIESRSKEDDTKWLMYWIVFSTFSMVELFADVILFWIPFYSFIKCVFLIYCMAPTSWNGSITIYNSIIRPFFLKHEEKIDKVMGRVTNMASEAKGLASDVMDDAEEAANRALQEGAIDATGNIMRRVLADPTEKH